MSSLHIVNQETNIKDLKRLIATKPNSPKLEAWKSQLASLEKNIKSENKPVQKQAQRQKQQPKMAKPRGSMQSRASARKLPTPYEKYLRMLADPGNSESVRCPDEVTDPTALITTTQTYNVSINTTANSNGAFAIMVQPKIGSVTKEGVYTPLQPDPDEYLQYFSGTEGNLPAVATVISKPGIIDLNDDAQYDYHVDSKAKEVTITPSKSYEIVGPGLITASIDTQMNNSGLYDINTIVSAKSDPDLLSWGRQQQNMVLPPSTTGSFGGVTLSSTSPQILGRNYFTGLEGWYNFLPYVINVSATMNVGDANVMMLIETDSTDKVLGYVRDTGGSTDAAYGSFLDKTRHWISSGTGAIAMNDWQAQINAANQSLFSQLNITFNFRAKNRYYLVNRLTFTGGGTNAVSIGFNMYSANLPPYGSQNTGAIAKTIRPIACSALLTNIAPALLTGGEVAIASLNRGQTNLWNNKNDLFRKMSDAELPFARNVGSAIKGAYAYWTPGDLLTRQLKTPDELNSADVGGIIIAGYATTSATTTTDVPTFLLRIKTVYEYYTLSPIVVAKPCKGLSTDFELVMHYLGAQKKAFENPSHTEKIADIILRGLFPMSNLMSGDTATERISNSFKFGYDVASSFLDM